MRLLAALLILVLWLAVTLLTSRPHDGQGTIAAVVTDSVQRQFVFACLLLLACAAILRWGDLGFSRARSGTLKLLWLPSAYVLVFLALGTAAGLPPVTVLLILAVNALLGAASEEMMFRGFLYTGLRDVLPIWPAILLCALLFGAPHVLNVFLIGHLGAAIGQAVFATFTGITFLALRIRTGSLLPVILLHAAWNFGLILVGREAPPLDPNAPLPVLPLVLTALGMLPVLAYPFWLLRRVGRDGDGLRVPLPPETIAPALRDPWGAPRT